MASPNPRADRVLLLAWLTSIFALSALSDLRVLSLACALALALFWRQAYAVGRRVLALIALFGFAILVHEPRSGQRYSIRTPSRG